LEGEEEAVIYVSDFAEGKTVFLCELGPIADPFFLAPCKRYM
jgi:hypothetical protein